MLLNEIYTQGFLNNNNNNCDIEKMAKLSHNLAKLIEFTLRKEKKFLNCFGKNDKKFAEKRQGVTSTMLRLVGWWGQEKWSG